MNDKFQGDDHITLTPYTSSVPYYFQATVASSSSMNDGGLPYNSSVCSFIVKVRRADGTTANSSGMVSNSTLNGNIMSVRLNYSTHLDEGLYCMTFVVTASVKGSTVLPLKKAFRFNRVYVER